MRVGWKLPVGVRKPFRPVDTGQLYWVAPSALTSIIWLEMSTTTLSCPASTGATENIIAKATRNERNIGEDPGSIVTELCGGLPLRSTNGFAISR
jgi:hypothetical protein